MKLTINTNVLYVKILHEKNKRHVNKEKTSFNIYEIPHSLNSYDV